MLDLEEHVRSVRQWLEAILDHFTAVICIKGYDTRHLLVNRRFEELFGVPRREVFGKTNHEIFPPEVADILTAHDQMALKSAAPQECEEVMPGLTGPRTFQALRFTLRDKEGRVCGVCGIFSDITERRTDRDRQQRGRDLAELLVTSSADGILAFDTELRYTVWNSAMERISGIAASKVLGRNAFEAFPFLLATGEDRYFHAALAGQTILTRDRPYTVPESNRQGIFEGHYSPLYDTDQRVIGGVAVIRDVTERRRVEEERLALAAAEAARAEAEAAARKFAFLAEAGEALSSSLDYEQTLREVARLAVPMLGDLCIVDVVEDGRLRRVAATHTSPDKAKLLEELHLGYPPTPDSPHPAARVLRNGEPQLVPDVDSAVVAAHTCDAGHAALIRDIGIRSYLAVPMVARDTTIGVITLAISKSARRYGAADLALSQELARRAALAVDNARLYQAAQDELAERRRAEEALRLSEGRFRAVLEQSPLSTQIFAKDGTPVQTNRAFTELWGLTLDSLLNYNILADRQLEVLGILPLLRRAFAGEAVELPAVRYDPNESVPDGSQNADPVRWVRAFAYPIKDGAGNVREVVLMHEDVTARLKAEQKLRMSEESLRLALLAARMCVWSWDLSTNEVECSENAREFWGIDVGHAADFQALIHPEDRAAVRQAAVSAEAGQEPYYWSEYRLRSPDGQVRWMQSRGRVDRTLDGRPCRIVGVTVDITDLKSAEAATRLLADAGEMLGASLDSQATMQNLARVVVPRIADWCTVDLLSESGELERVTVYPPNLAGVVLANELFKRHPPRPSDPYGAWHVLATGQPEWVEEISDEVLRAIAYDDDQLRILHEVGLRSYVCVPLIARGAALGVLTLVYAESGRHYRSADVELARDLARRAAVAVDNARLYQRLRAEDRRKDEFLATLAHELRNPLAPIRTGLEILRVSEPGLETKKTREMMERQLGHMVRLIDDLLDLSRITSGKVKLRREPVDLESIVNLAIEAARPLVDAAGLELLVRLPAEPIEFEGDRTRLAQVLSNLLNNAAKYTERGGRIELDAGREGEAVVFRVKDSGIGIPREMLTRIFEMFTQLGQSLERSQRGLGIGLTLVRHLVELHGGTVWAESEGPGRGSTFVVRLPSLPAAAARTRSPLPTGARATASQRVLIVDDNLDAAESLATLLELEGHEVRTAASGPAALLLVQEFRPDVAFLDIGLPGMNGYDLARRFRLDANLAGITLVALTGWGQAEDRRQSKAAGFDHHLIKPVDPRDVQALLR